MIIDTDVSRARAHASGQAFSEAVHAQMPDIDAILFDSRLTAGQCVAVYDRAFPALSGTPPIGLIQSALLPAEIARLKIILRQKRGFTP